MRLWSLHPKYLDLRGLTACWRETLLARKVLAGHTVGYRAHPQLIRFRAMSNPLDSIDGYLLSLYAEAQSRGYNFDRSKIGSSPSMEPILVTSGQLLYERDHLLHKLRKRAPAWSEALCEDEGWIPESHPLFKRIEGGVEQWEKI